MNLNGKIEGKAAKAGKKEGKAKEAPTPIKGSNDQKETNVDTKEETKEAPASV